jgi:protein O-mannosyl-transferase
MANRSKARAPAHAPTVWWRRGWFLSLLVVGCTVLAYLPATKCGYIWDDDHYVTGNPLLAMPDGLKRIWFSFDSPSQYFPLTYTVLRAEYALWGLNPAGYHWLNILLHATNALLLWRLLLRLRIPGAWFGAMLWALHPVQVESVAWIAELKNVLMGLFFLLALRFWLECIEAEGKRCWRFYAASLVCYALALLAKTTACTLPAALLLVVWLKQKAVARLRWLQMGPYVLLGLGMGLLTVWWERHHQGTHGQAFSVGVAERVLIAGRGVWFYLCKLFWPVNLTFSYPRWQASAAEPGSYVWLLAFVAAGAVIFCLRRYTGRGVAVAALFFIATLSPVLGFIMLYTFRYSFVADHYQYLASIGPLTLAAAGLSGLGGIRPSERHTLPQVGLSRAPHRGKSETVSQHEAVSRGRVALLALLPILGILTWQQSGVYHDPETLWRDTLAKNPTSSIAHNNFGEFLVKQGKLKEAVPHYERALQLDPDFPEAHNNLGNALTTQGKPEEAFREYERALQLNPLLAEAHNNLGNALAARGKPEEEICEYERALQLNPFLVEAHNNLGSALAAQGKLDEAIRHYELALQLNPLLAVVHNNLGRALAVQGKLEEAIRHYERALQLKPNYSEARYYLGNALAALAAQRK